MGGIVRLHAGHALALPLAQILLVRLPVETRSLHLFRLEL